MAIIGIDLGTTNSLVGVYRDSSIELVRNSLGSVLTPSVVALSDDGDIIVGQTAKEMVSARPDLAVSSFKRWMGSDKTTALGRNSFRAEELSAFVLRSLIGDFKDKFNEPIDEIVISCPAYFNDPQRKATINAAKLAGLTVERLVNEPTAAVLAYGLEMRTEGKFLVFDLGGGTFDVSILDKYDGLFEVRATAGDSHLGGDDFTSILTNLLLTRNGLDAGGLEDGERRRIWRSADDMKTALTTQQSVNYAFTAQGRIVEGVLEREEFETECAGLLRRLRAPLERTIRDTSLSIDDLDAIVLVGGATRMPMVRSLVARLFGKLPFVNINPDEVVCKGAAIQAALKARDQSIEDVVMTDVCPFTLGISISRERQDRRREQIMSPLIERNAVIPISRNDTFMTVDDYQTRIKVDVFQGENLRPSDNVFIGDLTVEVPRKPAGEESVDVRFTYDINGALEVIVRSETTGKTERAVFSNNSGLSEAEFDKRFKQLEKIKLAPREQEENRVLIMRAERIYTELLGPDRQLLADAISRFSSIIEDQHAVGLESERENFSRFLDEFERFTFDG